MKWMVHIALYLTEEGWVEANSISNNCQGCNITSWWHLNLLNAWALWHTAGHCTVPSCQTGLVESILYTVTCTVYAFMPVQWNDAMTYMCTLVFKAIHVWNLYKMTKMSIMLRCQILQDLVWSTISFTYVYIYVKCCKLG